MTTNNHTIRHDDVPVIERNDSTLDAAALRHHLEALILKLAEAQAGSIAAVRKSRRHAEAALRLVDARTPRDSTPVATVPDLLALDEPVNSL